MDSYESDVLKRLKAQYPQHVALLQEKGYGWYPTLARFWKSARGTRTRSYSPERLGEISIEELKSEIGS